MSTINNLVRMANQIAANLMQESDPAAATAEHIRLFWDPRMKAMIAGDGVPGLSDTARAAIRSLSASQSG